MAYQEVDVIEAREILRAWLAGNDRVVFSGWPPESFAWFIKQHRIPVFP
ncbi:hypothetical protein [Saccharopolyspora hattusasensis]